MSLYREFDHTGDAGIEVEADSRGELFRCAAIALAELMVDPGNVRPVERRDVRIERGSDVDLIHDLLTELLNLFITHGFIWREVEIEEADYFLAAHLSGERLDSARHGFKTEIKAVTYHQLAVTSESGRWRARVIFDI